MEGGKIKSFTDLYAWQKGHQLVLNVYKYTKHFPKEELFGLTNQLRRASVSITSNISEGFSRKSKKEKQKFYRIALGSLLEVQNQIIIARDIGYIQTIQFKQLAEQSIVVNKLINGLIKSASKPLNT